MRLNMLCAAALASSLAVSGAFAQATSSTEQDPDKVGDALLLKDRDRMGSFFTDDTMSSLRSDDEVKSAWSAMSPDDQTAMRAGCEAIGRGGDTANVADPASPSVLKLCDTIATY